MPVRIIGFGLMCACELVVAREGALMGVSAVRVGLFPMMILPDLLRVVPPRRLMEMCLTAGTYTATQARAEGFVNHTAPADGLDAALDALLARITDKSPTGIRLGKQALMKIREMSTECAQFMLANMARTEDAREGFAAFGAKRALQWTGR